MPIFLGNGPLSVQVGPGSNLLMFTAADVLVAPATSRVYAPLAAAGVKSPSINFNAQYAAAPTAVVQIYGSNVPPTSAGPQNGTLLWTSTNKQTDTYIDTTGYAFYWAVLLSQSAGGALTLTGHIN